MTETQTTIHYPQPSAEQMEEIRQRLAELSPEVLKQVEHALKHDPIQNAGGLLWKAGVCLSSAELYEYRKTLFPPNALVDPYTQGAAVLRAERVERDCVEPPHAVTNERLVSPHHQLTGSDLLDDLRDVIKRYVVLPEMAAETLALWVVHTYAFTLRQVTTYIGVVSPEKRCGKTTLLELLARLANRSLTAANISPSAMFRVIEETQPTLIIDEADTFLEGRDELAGILNAGYRKGNSYVVRVADRKKVGRGVPAEPSRNALSPGFAEWTPDHGPLTTDNGRLITDHGSLTTSQLIRYSCWCPKVMAAIGRLPDTLADRCIMITMQRKMAGEKCERMRHLNATDLRRRCAQFVREHSDEIADAQPEIPPALNDRAADIWEPLELTPAGQSSAFCI